MDEKKFWKIIAVLAVVGLFLIAIAIFVLGSKIADIDLGTVAVRVDKMPYISVDVDDLPTVKVKPESYSGFDVNVDSIPTVKIKPESYSGFDVNVDVDSMPKVSITTNSYDYIRTRDY